MSSGHRLRTDDLKTKRNAMRALFLAILCAGSAIATSAQGFDAQEFADRRAHVFQQTGDALTLVIGNPEHPHAVRFHQAPDFFYLTGISEPDGVLVMDGATKTSTVFLRRLTTFEAMWNGPRLLNNPHAEKTFGIAIKPLSDLEDYLENVLVPGRKIYFERTPPDQLQESRGEVAMSDQQERNHPLYGNRPTIVEAAVAKLRSIQEDIELADVSPILDKMRWTKSSYEIARMREAGRIGAEGFVEAIKGTRPGVLESELEAEARYVYQRNGAGDAFLPIVASGRNTLIIHYQENDARTKPGDVILMDYGAEVDGYTSDITRMWPVSGQFTPEQEKMYRCVLEASKAIIAAVKPGVMEADLQDVAEEVYRKHGYLSEFQQFGRYVGHPVGLSVHDPDPGVGPAPDVSFEVGTVFNVEPLLSVPALGVHMRLEDTILVTENGAENLTAGAPVEIDEIYALIRSEEGTK